MNTRQAIYNLAVQLHAQAQTMTFAQLVQWLNTNGYTTDYGTPYQHPRGAASAVRAAYNYVHYQLGLGNAGAAPIAAAFTDANGNYVYK